MTNDHTIRGLVLNTPVINSAVTYDLQQKNDCIKSNSATNLIVSKVTGVSECLRPPLFNCFDLLISKYLLRHVHLQKWICLCQQEIVLFPLLQIVSEVLKKKR